MIKKSQPYWRAVVCALLLATAAVTWVGHTPALGSPPIKTSSVTRAILLRYRTLRSYQATIRSVTTLQPLNGSTPNTIDSTMQVAFKAPNLYRVDVQGMMGGGSQVCDGKTLTRYSALTNQYSRSPAPKESLFKLISQAASSPTTTMVGRAVVNGVPTIEYAGTTKFGHSDARMLVYVDQATHLIDRIVIADNALPGPQGANFHLNVREDYLAQKLNPSLPEKLFVFTPPAGAQESQQGQMPTNMGFPN